MAVCVGGQIRTASPRRCGSEGSPPLRVHGCAPMNPLQLYYSCTTAAKDPVAGVLSLAVAKRVWQVGLYSICSVYIFTLWDVVPVVLFNSELK